MRLRQFVGPLHILKHANTLVVGGGGVSFFDEAAIKLTVSSYIVSPKAVAVRIPSHLHTFLLTHFSTTTHYSFY